MGLLRLSGYAAAQTLHVATTAPPLALAARRRLATMVKYLGQAEAQEVDVQLMGPHYAYSVEQLMELAGLRYVMSICQPGGCRGLSLRRCM